MKIEIDQFELEVTQGKGELFLLIRPREAPQRPPSVAVTRAVGTVREEERQRSSIRFDRFCQAIRDAGDRGIKATVIARRLGCRSGKACSPLVAKARRRWDALPFDIVKQGKRGTLYRANGKSWD